MSSEAKPEMCGALWGEPRRSDIRLELRVQEMRKDGIPEQLIEEGVMAMNEGVEVDLSAQRPRLESNWSH